MGLIFMVVTRLNASREIGFEGAPKRIIALLENRDPLERASATARLLSQVEPENIPASGITAIRFAFEASDQLYDGDVEFALLGAWWAQFDPEAAYQWTRTSPRGASRRVLVAVMNEWGAQDPLAAVLAAGTEGSEVRRQDGLAAAITGADRSVLATSTDLVSVLEQIPNRADRRIALQALIALQLRRETPREYLARAAQLRITRSQELAEDWIAATAMVIAMDDPVLASESLSKFVRPNSTLPPGVVTSIASSWGAVDPVAALEWLSTLGPDEERSDAVRTTYRYWLGRNYASAVDWAAQRAENPDAWFDPIRGNYAYILGQKQPREALRLLFMLPINDERALYVQQVFARWKATDPEPAAIWLQQTDLPEFRKEQLRLIKLPSRFPRKPASNSDSKGAAES